MHTVLEVQLLHVVLAVYHSFKKRFIKRYLLDMFVQTYNYFVSPTRVTLVAPLLIAMRASGSIAYVASSMITDLNFYATQPWITSTTTCCAYNPMLFQDLLLLNIDQLL